MHGAQPESLTGNEIRWRFRSSPAANPVYGSGLVGGP